MKHLTLSLFLVLATTLFAQDSATFPLNAEGKAEYGEVVTIEGASTADLYARLNTWYTSYYKNPTAVIKTKEENKKIAGQHGVDIFNYVKGKKIRKGLVKYNISVSVKDGKYKFTINDIFMVSQPKTYVHQWLNTDDKMHTTNQQYVGQVNTFMEGLIVNLKATMAKPLPAAASDDW